MATTTATFTLSSADIAPSPVSISTSATLYKAGLNTGLDQTTGMSRRILKTSETGKTILLSPALYGMTLVKEIDGGTGADDITANTANFTYQASLPAVDLGVNVGMTAYATGITDGTTVASIESATALSLSANPSATIGANEGTVAFFERATANKANKVYICNSSTTSEDYFEVIINQEIIGRLYGGDWMFMPWSVSDLDSEIYVRAAVHTTPVIIDYMVVGEGNAA
tara:strand:+ start:67 stop:747 length:681 start_codon:yes stop_codon:yes gene_type:complete